MTRRPLVGLALCLVTLAGCSHRPPPIPKVGVLSDCEHRALRPTTILVACGDGSVSLTKLTYTSYSDSAATGKAVAIANDFTPNRAQGHDKSYPATFTLDAAKPTKAGLVFTRLTVHYDRANPYGKATDVWPIGP